MVPISKIQQLSEFLETFPEHFCTICRCFQIFEVLGEWKTPFDSLCTINFIAEKMNELLAYFVSRQSQGGLVKYQLL